KSGPLTRPAFRYGSLKRTLAVSSLLDVAQRQQGAAHQQHRRRFRNVRNVAAWVASEDAADLQGAGASLGWVARIFLSPSVAVSACSTANILDVQRDADLPIGVESAQEIREQQVGIAGQDCRVAARPVPPLRGPRRIAYVADVEGAKIRLYVESTRVE